MHLTDEADKLMFFILRNWFGNHWWLDEEIWKKWEVVGGPKRLYSL